MFPFPQSPNRIVAVGVDHEVESADTFHSNASTDAQSLDSHMERGIPGGKDRPVFVPQL
jgi:hypothetical protein